MNTTTLFATAPQFILTVSRYGTNSTFFIATSGVANRQNRPAILPLRALTITIKNALYVPFN